jgi:hypothetical protein
MRRFLIAFMLLFLTSCASINLEQGGIDKPNSSAGLTQTNEKRNAESLINESGNTVQERIRTPEGFERVKVNESSYGQYLRNLPLKPHGSKVRIYNGEIKKNDVYEAVLDIDAGDRDLQQCADAVIRLRAEYLYSQGLYEKIHFNFTNGFEAGYPAWMNGNRIKVEGNKASWVQKAEYSNEYSSFRKYLDMVFAYAGTLSLSKEMKKVSIEDMQTGDVFLKGASPGHAVTILDMAENLSTGEKIFIIAQSYMPAQDIHILKNQIDKDLSPWYPANFGETLSTPEWQFTKSQLMRFQE